MEAGDSGCTLDFTAPANPEVLTSYHYKLHFAFYTGEAMWVASSASLSAQVATSCCQAPLWTTMTRKRCVAILVLLSNGQWSTAIAILYKLASINIHVVLQHMLVLNTCNWCLCTIVSALQCRKAQPSCCGPRIQPIKLPKLNAASAIISQAFLITGEEVGETAVGCCNEHMTESRAGSSWAAKYHVTYTLPEKDKVTIKQIMKKDKPPETEDQDQPFQNASVMTHLVKGHCIPLV